MRCVVPPTEYVGHGNSRYRPIGVRRSKADGSGETDDNTKLETEVAFSSDFRCSQIWHHERCQSIVPSHRQKTDVCKSRNERTTLFIRWVQSITVAEENAAGNRTTFTTPSNRSPRYDLRTSHMQVLSRLTSPTSDCATATALCRAELLVSCSTAPRPVRRQAPAALPLLGSRIRAVSGWRPATTINYRASLHFWPDAYVTTMRPPLTEHAWKNISREMNAVLCFYITLQSIAYRLKCPFVSYRRTRSTDTSEHVFRMTSQNVKSQVMLIVLKPRLSGDVHSISHATANGNELFHWWLTDSHHHTTSHLFNLLY